MDTAIAGLIDELLDTTAGRLEDVAEEAGVSYSALYSWATGRRRPSRKNVKRLVGLAERRSKRLSRVADRLRRRTGRAKESAS